MTKTRLSSAVLLALLAGCRPLNPLAGSGLSSQSSSTTVPDPARSRAVREFYVRPGVTQYLLLPQRLAGPDGHYAELDLVVRDSATVPRYALLHTSLVGPASARPFTAATDTLLLSTATGPVPVAATRVLYTEAHGKNRLTRLEAVLPVAQLRAYLQGPDYSLLTAQPGQPRRRYQPEKKAAKNLRGFAPAVSGQ